MIFVAAPGFGPSLPRLPRREHEDDDSGHPHQCPCRGLGRSGAMAKSTKRICQRMVIVVQILGPLRSAISWSCVSLVFGLVSETRCTAPNFSLAVPGAGHAGSRGGKAPTMSFLRQAKLAKCRASFNTATSFSLEKGQSQCQKESRETFGRKLTRL